MPLVFSTIILLLAPAVFLSHQAFASQLSISPPSLKDSTGETLSRVIVGQQIVLSTLISNPTTQKQSFTVVMEVRDESDFTVSLAWLSGTIHENDDFNVGLSWVPTESGKYHIRNFVVSDLKNPQSLSSIETTQILVEKSAVSTGAINKPAEESNSKPSVLTNFAVAWDTQKYTAWFSVTDENQKEIATDGTASLSIVDDSGKVLYVSGFNISAKDFQNLNYANRDFLGYMWTFPLADVQSSIGKGVAKISFTGADGEVLRTTAGGLYLPQLTGEQLQQAYEAKYLASAIPVNQKITQGNLEITLVRVGHFTHLQYGSWGDEVKRFRADFIITNVGSGYEYLPTPTDFIILDDASNQYDSGWSYNTGGTLEFKEIHAGVTANGYMVYDDVSDKASWINVIVKKANYPEDYIWEFKVPLKAST